MTTTIKGTTDNRRGAGADDSDHPREPLPPRVPPYPAPP